MGGHEPLIALLDANVPYPAPMWDLLIEQAPESARGLRHRPRRDELDD